ncbi:hypothetical protein [Methyloglobulus sp.]|nr:hypothetical protein [Methyloglobulus sp.]
MHKTNHANISIKLTVRRNPTLEGNSIAERWVTTRPTISGDFVNVAMRV